MVVVDYLTRARSPCSCWLIQPKEHIHFMAKSYHSVTEKGS